jgi:hypothetical protein
MAKEIHDKFDKAEAVVERTGKLILKIVTALVGIAIGIVVALEQLDYHIISDDPAEEEYYEEEIDEVEQQKEFIQEQYEQYSK